MRLEEDFFGGTDSVILGACPRGANLAAGIIARRLPATAIIDLA